MIRAFPEIKRSKGKRWCEPRILQEPWSGLGQEKGLKATYFQLPEIAGIPRLRSGCLGILRKSCRSGIDFADYFIGE
jgi:hypothetical protein